MNKKHLFITLLAGLLVVLALVLLPSNDKSVLAQTASDGDGEMRGFAWSSNIGWVSFNSKDLPNPSATYSVKINDNNTLEGYAWSSNLGWLRFGSDLTGPDGNDTEWGAKIEGDKLTGWARFCSVYVSGCSGATKDVNGTELGGWDGWLKMSDVNYDATTGGFSGFAWGSLNVGWLKFGLHPDNPITCPVDLVGDCCPAWQVCGGGGGGGFSVSCSVAPAQTSIGENVTWTATVSGGVTPYNYVWSRATGSTGNPFINSNPAVIEDEDSGITSFTASYDSAGTYIAKVRVSDSGSNSQEVVCNSGSQDGVIITEDCVQPGHPIGPSGEACCDGSEPVEQEDGTYICPNQIEACGFGLGGNPPWMTVAFDDHSSYSCSVSDESIPVNVSPTTCNSLDINFSGQPSGLELACFQQGAGGFTKLSSCQGLQGQDLIGLKIGACANSNDVKGWDLDGFSCLKVNISGNNGTPIEKKVCFTGAAII